MNKYNMLFKACFIFAIFSPIFILCDQTNPCGDNTWNIYKDKKCFKLFQKWENKDEASKLCNQQSLESEYLFPMLASIESPEEQHFLKELIFIDLEIDSNVWIGAIRTQNSTEFLWAGKSDIIYENWDTNSPSNDMAKNCVVMQSNLAKSTISGKWRDVSCNSGNYFLCQKLQIWSFPQLQNEFLIEKKETKYNFENFNNSLAATKAQIEVKINKVNSDLTNMLNSLTTEFTNEKLQTKTKFDSFNNGLNTTNAQLSSINTVLTNELNGLTTEFTNEKIQTQSKFDSINNELASINSVLTNKLNALTTELDQIKNNLAKCITQVRLSSVEHIALWRGPGYWDGGGVGYVITGVDNFNKDDFPDEIFRRKLETLVNGQWIPVNGL